MLLLNQMWCVIPPVPSERDKDLCGVGISSRCSRIPITLHSCPVGTSMCTLFILAPNFPQTTEIQNPSDVYGHGGRECTMPEIWNLNCPNLFSFTLPCRHHVWEPDSAQMLRNLPVDLIQGVFVIWNQHLLHDWKLGKPPPTHFDELNERTAGHLALTQADSRQLGAVLSNAYELLVQRTQAVGAHHQLHQAGAVKADAA